jgi:hypothetical protein
MSPIPLGILAVAGSGGGPADFELISTQVLGGNATSVTFGSIPQTYRHLQIRMVAQSDTFAQVGMVFNGVNTSTYYYNSMAGGASSVTSSEQFTQPSIIMSYGSSTSGGSIFAASIIDILEYSQTTKFKTIRAFAGNATGASLVSGSNSATTGISSITFYPNTASFNFKVNSRFSLYGIKG